MKTAPDPASGILDQYELGPYNLIILGQASRWHELSTYWDAGVDRKVALLSPCSVLISRAQADYEKGHLFCIDGSEHCLDSMRRAAVLSHHCDKSITLLSVATDNESLPWAEEFLAEVRELLDEIDIEVVDSLILVGDPVKEICQLAPDYSLVVVSDPGKFRLKRFFVGSVAFKVMGHAPVSVLNVC